HGRRAQTRGRYRARPAPRGPAPGPADDGGALPGRQVGAGAMTAEPVSRVRRALVRGEPLAGAVSGADHVAAGELLHLDSAVRAEIRGAGPLQGLLDDPAVTDVLVNGGEGGVWVDRGTGLEPCHIEGLDAAAVRGL